MYPQRIFNFSFPFLKRVGGEMSIQVSIENEIHKQLKDYCERNGLKMTIVVGQVISHWLKTVQNANVNLFGFGFEPCDMAKTLEEADENQ